MYPDVSQMYLTCSVTFQENTCILTFCMYFTRIPNESKIHFGIHIRYIKIHVSWALPWCHTGYMSGYIRIRVSWTLHHDTSYDTSQDTPRYKITDTCILDASWRGTYLICKIHAGYMRDTCICKGDQDTCGIHPRYMMRYMYLKCIPRERCSDMKETCGIHMGYMRDTCILRGNQDTCGIHAEYIRDTCGIHTGYMQDTYLGGLGVSKRGRK